MKYIIFLLLPFSVFGASFLPSSFSVEMNQVITKITTGKKKVTKATLDYQFPSRLKFINENNSIFISNLERSWYYSPPFIKGEKGTVKLNGSDSLKIVKLFDALKNGLKSNSTYKVDKTAKDKFELAFTSSAVSEFNISKALLKVSEKKMREINLSSKTNKMPTKNKNKKTVAKSSFSLNDIKSILLTYKDGKQVTLVFNDFKSNISFSGDHFVFEIPKGTKVIK